MLGSIPFLSSRVKIKRGLVLGLLIVGALIAFETFNYSTTDFALTDLLGNLSFLGVRWATILAIAFCGIDFAGIARLFTPEQRNGELTEVWYLFGAWMLAAVMNAMLTWWGVSIAILNHETLGNAVVSRGTLLSVVPIFVAVMIWLIRVLIIGTISMAGERMFSQSANKSVSKQAVLTRQSSSRVKGRKNQRSERTVNSPVMARSNRASTNRPNLKRGSRIIREQGNKYDQNLPAEPTYTPVSMSGSSDNSRTAQTRF